MHPIGHSFEISRSFMGTSISLSDHGALTSYNRCFTNLTLRGSGVLLYCIGIVRSRGAM